MISMEHLTRAVCDLFKKDTIQRRIDEAFDRENPKGFHHGPLIYHTKTNPNRKVRTALTANQICNLEYHLKSRWPVRFWLQETMPSKVHSFLFVYIKMPMHNLFWSFRWRFEKKHQYHIIRPRTLQPGYHDLDTRMIHAIFEMVVTFCEVENLDGHVNNMTNEDIEQLSGPDKDRYEVYKQLIQLKDWWILDRPYRGQRYDRLVDQKLEILNKDSARSGRSDSLMEIFRKNSNLSELDRQKIKQIDQQLNEMEQSWTIEDKNKMKQVIDVWEYMWT